MPLTDNAPSLRILKKAGYVREGYLCRSVIKKGVMHDQILFAYIPNGPALLK